MEELTLSEKQLLRSILDEIELLAPVSFNIKDKTGAKIVVEGVDEFFNAPQIIAFYGVYARYVLSLYKQNAELQQKILDYEALFNKTDEFRKAPQRAINIEEV